MRENKTQLSTFIMFCMLITISSINKEIFQSKSHLAYASNRDDKNNEERMIRDKKVILRVRTSKEMENSSNEKEKDDDKSNMNNPSEDDESNQKNNNLKGSSSTSSALIYENQIKNNSINNKTDSSQIKNIYERPSIFSFFPYSLSMNLIGISSENTTNSEIHKDDEAHSNSDQTTKDSSVIMNNSRSYNFNESFIEQDPAIGYQISLIDNSEKKYISMLTLIIFGTFYLIVRLILSSCKNSKNERTKYFIKGIKIITNQNFLYFILMTFLMTFSTFGLFNSIKVNWDYLITSIAISGVAWVMFCIFILFFCMMIANKWDEHEINSRNSFGNI